MENNKIIIATHNKDKLIEIRSRLNLTNIKVYSLFDFPEIGEIPETGKTLEENALLKAKTVFDITGIASLSDDTGLEVNAFDGAPGVYSARWAGINCSYKDNVDKMIEKIQKVSVENRNAQFRTVMAFVDKSMEHFETGIIKGEIIDDPKGVGGFGYDPVFYVPEKNKTLAQMSKEEKLTISHRGIALKKIIYFLKKYFENKT